MRHLTGESSCTYLHLKSATRFTLKENMWLVCSSHAGLTGEEGHQPSHSQRRPDSAQLVRCI